MGRESRRLKRVGERGTNVPGQTVMMKRVKRRGVTAMHRQVHRTHCNAARFGLIYGVPRTSDQRAWRSDAHHGAVSLDPFWREDAQRARASSSTLTASAATCPKNGPSSLP